MSLVSPAQGSSLERFQEQVPLFKAPMERRVKLSYYFQYRWTVRIIEQAIPAISPLVNPLIAYIRGMQ